MTTAAATISDHGLLAAIFAATDDPLPRLVYADWLEERGVWAEAAAWRWFAETRRFPWASRLTKTGSRFFGVDGVPSWDWWRHCASELHDLLPDCVFDRLRGGSRFEDECVEFISRESAELACIAAAAEAIAAGELKP